MNNNATCLGSNLNSHFLKLFFSISSLQTSGSPVDSAQMICTIIECDELKSKSETEKRNLKGASSVQFEKPVDIEFIFKRKQTARLCLCFNTDTSIEIEFVIGELIGSKSNALELTFGSKDRISGVMRVTFEGTRSLEQSMEIRQKEDLMFFDYLSSDLNISVIACIDFTASNGYYHLPNSLHRLAPGYLNDYQAVITSVCEVLLPYDSDKLIQTYGFGGIPSGLTSLENPPGKVSHFFPLTGDWKNCAGYGIKGVFDIYTQALSKVELSGPTFFAPMFQEINKFTVQSVKQDPDNYTVLLVITDGSIHDINRTIDEIIAGSELPLSIIIVGVGDADFTKMKKLDGDGMVLTSKNGKIAKRDIVQFVHFNQFRGKPREHLADAVLEELPSQVCEYLKLLEHSEGMSRTDARNELDHTCMNMDRMTSPLHSFDNMQSISKYSYQASDFNAPVEPLALYSQSKGPANPHNSMTSGLNPMSTQGAYYSLDNHLHRKDAPQQVNTVGKKLEESYVYPHSEVQNDLKRRMSVESINQTLPSIDVMTYINQIQANPNKFQSGVDLSHGKNHQMQKQFNPSLFQSPTARKGSDNFTLDSSINTPRDRTGFVQHYQQQHEVKSPFSQNVEQPNLIPPRLDYLAHGQYQTEPLPKTDLKLPKAPVKKPKYPPKTAQVFVSELEDQQTERFDFSAGQQSKVAEMIESQVTCVDYQAGKHLDTMQVSEIEAKKIQPFIKNQGENDQDESEKLNRNIFGVDGEFFDSMLQVATW